MAGFLAHLARRAVTLTIGLYYGAVVSGGLLVDFVRNGRGLFYFKKRDKRPECLDDPALGKHKFLQLEVRVQRVTLDSQADAHNL